MKTEQRPAAPNEVHPAYAGNAVVNDWVNGCGPDVHLHTLRLAVLPMLRFDLNAEPEKIGPSLNHLTLDLHTCWGAAPYVGHRFVYAWRVATDELGRMVAGEAWRQYIPDRP